MKFNKKKRGVGMKGTWTIKEIDTETGEVISEEIKENIVVDDGADRVAEYINGDSVDDFDYMAVGDGAIAGDSPSSDTSALVSEQDRSGALTSEIVDGNTVRWAHTFDAGDGKAALTEAGMFDDPSAGTMLNHIIFDTEKDNENNDLQLTIDLEVQSG